MTCCVHFFLNPTNNLLYMCFIGYWAPFKISQSLPKHSAATRAATWSLNTPAVCGDPQTSEMGIVLTWVVPVPLQYLSPLTGSLVGGCREVKAPLTLFTGWTRAGGLTLQYALPPRKAVDCTLTDRRSTVSPTLIL